MAPKRGPGARGYRSVAADSPIPQRAARGRAPSAEVTAVWALFAADALAILVTYSRLPPSETYHVTLGGLSGGLSRVVVFLCFPTALAAVAVLGLVVERLHGRWVTPAAIIALLLCASVAWPGVVEQADLDVKWSNAFAAVGVLVVLLLSL